MSSLQTSTGKHRFLASDMTASPSDISAVVCTRDSIESIETCLMSLRTAGVGQLIVVDADSTDGTREIAENCADVVLHDDGVGLGAARNIGIANTTSDLILNMGSDNVMPGGQLERMINDLEHGEYAGVSARTRIEGPGYAAKGLNSWRRGRFPSGEVRVIGTPTLFRGELLRANPYDPTRRFSDDSELCERWSRDFGARFAISDAEVLEVGKTTWPEVVTRCRMYGVSDAEVFARGRQQGWSLQRQAKSLFHPLQADFVTPLRRLPAQEALAAAPFLGAFATLRYGYWAATAFKGR